MKFYCGNENEYIGSLYNDTFLGNAMMLRYFKIPNDVFVSLMNKYPSGFEMRIELVDNKAGTGEYAFHNFGYLHINQSLEETREAMYYFLNSLNKDRSEIDVKTIQAHYFNNAGLKEVFYSVADTIDDGFETQDSFIKDWYFDRTYYEDVQNVPTHLDKVISTGSTRPGDSNMPFNKTGNGFFRGWYEASEDSGFIAGDTARYRFISRPFVLSGDSIISIKMGGTASLHVIDATTNPGNNHASDLAWIDNRSYSTSGDEILTNGFNTCTMVRHIINLSAYAGRTVQLAICDYSTGGWGAAYFDELKVNIDLKDIGFNIDALTQNHINGNAYKPVYLDRYINSEFIENNGDGIKYVNGSDAISDTSSAKEAYDYINNYLSYVRANNGQQNVCDNSIRKSETMKGLINDYNDLSVNTKKIVCASNDYQRSSGDWAMANVSIFSLGESIRGIAMDNNIAVITYHTTNTISRTIEYNHLLLQSVLIIASSISVIALSIFLFKKRKER